MTCDRCSEAVSAILDGEAVADDWDAVGRHLPVCGSCRSLAQRMAGIARLVAASAAEPAPDLVADLQRRLAEAGRSLPGAPDTRALRLVGRSSCGCAPSCACGCQQGRACRCGSVAA